MRTTKGRDQIGRSTGGRLRPSFDRLEPRTALSGTPFDSNPFGAPGQFDSPTASGPLAIRSTEPASSVSLTASPSSLGVTFNKTLDGFSIGLADFQLVHVNGDGSTSPMLPGEARLGESLDPAGNQIDLSLSRPLLEGHYRLILLGTNQISGIDGSQVADPGQDEILADFSIAPVQSGIDSATDLGTVGPLVVSETGNLNLSTNPGAVNYYRVDLAPGHHWSLGLAVVAQDQPNPLATTLSLFDFQGKLVATDSTGLQSDPGDPFLFQGLDPGTYYVGVSAQGNIPNASGTYAPAASLSSVQETGSGGNTYQIEAVASVADEPISVLGLRLDQADPLVNNPTGVTIQFSGAIQLAGLDQPTQPALQLVDGNGRTWGLTTVGYNSSLGQLQVVFDQPLPEGDYKIEVTGPTSLVDLGGFVPVANGLSAGELGSFQVGPTVVAPANDLGPIEPGSGTAGLSAIVKAVANATTTRQFVVVEPGFYSIDGVSSASGVTYTLEDASGTLLTTGPQDTISGERDIPLGIGTYTLTFSNPSGHSVDIPLEILHKARLFSELMDGGIAQGAALSLRLVTPQANFGAVPIGATTNPVGDPAGSGMPGSTTSAVSGASPGSSAVASVHDASGGATTVGLATPAGPAVSGLLYGFGPVGLPSAQSNQISVVGSTGLAGTLALASNSSGLSNGLMGIPESRSTGSRGGLSREVPEADLEVEGLPETPRISSTDAGLLARPPQSRRADDQSLAGADWISRIVTAAVGWLEESTIPSNEPVAGPVGSPVLVATQAGSLAIEEPRVESASLGSPVSVAAALLAIAYRYRRKLPTLWKRLAAEPNSSSRSSRQNLV